MSAITIAPGEIEAAPASTLADVDYAIDAGSDVMVESDSYGVLGAIDLSCDTLRKMHQNLFWTVGYNLIIFQIGRGDTRW